jgi:DNA-binding response OmpR family regulator
MKYSLFHDITILFVEDEQDVRQNIAHHLSRYFKKIYLVDDGTKALDLFYEYHPDIIVTDIEIAGIDGVELINSIREYDKDVPIIVMTECYEKETLLKLVSLHLFEYIVKPVTYDKLIDLLFQCVENHPNFSKRNVVLDKNLRYSFSKKLLFKNDKQISLTHYEIELLELLINHKGEVVNYESIEYHVYKDKVMSSDAIKTLVKKLRNKLTENMITTVIGYGYRLL